MLKKSNQKGFTIIEVLIVLAIAAVILLVVFLAVPALQRNNRNTQRKNDVAGYVGAVNEFVTNNNGALPSTAAHITTVNGLVKVNTLTLPTSAPVSGAQSSALTIDTLQLVTGAKCDTSTVGNTVQGASRQFAVRYAVEGSGGTPVPQCVDN